MNINTRVIPIFVISISLCTACHQGSMPTPDGLTPSGQSTPQAETPSLDQSTPTQQLSEAPQKYPDIEEYAVYAALIKNEFSGDYIEQVLIMDHTAGVSQELLELNLKEWGITPDEVVVESFLVRNQKSNQLEPNLDMELDYQLLTQEEVDEFRPQYESGGWEAFNEKYPNASGFLTFSRVGFNADVSQALVFFEESMYDQLIEGGYYFMVWQDGQWVVEYSYVFNT